MSDALLMLTTPENDGIKWRWWKKSCYTEGRMDVMWAWQRII